MRGMVSNILMAMILTAGCAGRAVTPVATAAVTLTQAATAAVAPSATTSPATAAAVATATGPAATATAAPALNPSLAARLTNTCYLLNSSDLAALFSTAETQLPKPQPSTVTKPIFSAQPAAGKENTCVFYTFHEPGKTTGVMLQVSYWVYLPAAGSSPAWATAWKAAQDSAAQPITGVGEEAFFKNGRLSFVKNGVYFTLEVLGSGVEAATLPAPGSGNPSLDLEKRLAADMLSHLD